MRSRYRARYALWVRSGKGHARIPRNSVSAAVERAEGGTQRQCLCCPRQRVFFSSRPAPCHGTGDHGDAVPSRAQVRNAAEELGEAVARTAPVTTSTTGGRARCPTRQPRDACAADTPSFI